MSHPKVFPHPSHSMPDIRIVPCNEHFMGKDAEYYFENTCRKCGGHVWGTNRSFDYDSRLVNVCRTKACAALAKERK